MACKSIKKKNYERGDNFQLLSDASCFEVSPLMIVDVINATRSSYGIAARRQRESGFYQAHAHQRTRRGERLIGPDYINKKGARLSLTGDLLESYANGISTFFSRIDTLPYTIRTERQIGFLAPERERERERCGVAPIKCRRCCEIYRERYRERVALRSKATTGSR